MLPGNIGTIYWGGDIACLVAALSYAYNASLKYGFVSTTA
jgi:hypothetical protein